MRQDSEIESFSIREGDRSKSGTDEAFSSKKRSWRRSRMLLKKNRACLRYLMTMYHLLYHRVYLQFTVRHHQIVFHANILRLADARLDFQLKLGNVENKIRA